MGRNLRRGQRVFESLEPRRLLAGNVTAQVVNGDLYIVGDAAANVIEVLGTGIDGQMLIRPAEASVASAAMYPVRVGPNRELIPLDPDTLQPISLAPTSINGAAGGQMISGITGDVRVYMGDGRDLVAITNVFVHGDLIIDTGAQSDGVVLGAFPFIADLGNAGFSVFSDSGSIGVEGSLQINLGAGDDRQTANAVYVIGDVLVAAGSGNDRPEFLRASAANMSFAMADGDDRLLLRGNTTTGALTVVLGEGANDIQIIGSTIVGGLGVVGDGSIDQLRVSLSRIESGLVAVMGEANDYIEFGQSVIAGTTTVVGGAGADKLFLELSTAEVFSVDLGGGNDQFLVSVAALDGLYAQLGDGDDWLDVVGSLIPRCSAIGGAGSDSLGAFASIGTSTSRRGKPVSQSVLPGQLHVPGSHPNMFNLGFETIGVQLPSSIRETPVPNTHYLLQTLLPIPGTGAQSGGSVVLGGGTLGLKYNYYGDINQDGQIDADDLTAFAGNFGSAFVGSGTVNIGGSVDAGGGGTVLVGGFVGRLDNHSTLAIDGGSIVVGGGFGEHFDDSPLLIGGGRVSFGGFSDLGATHSSPLFTYVVV